MGAMPVLLPMNRDRATRGMPRGQVRMLWIKKRFAHPDMWANTYLRTCADKLLLRFPQEFMMVQEKHSVLDATIWVRLPDPSLKTMFPGFIDGKIGDLTARPVKLAVDDSEFERAFGALRR